MRPPAGLSGRHGSLVATMLGRSGSAGWLDCETGKAGIGHLALHCRRRRIASIWREITASRTAEPGILSVVFSCMLDFQSGCCSS